MQRGEKFQPKIWWNRMDNVSTRPHFLPEYEAGNQDFVEVRSPSMHLRLPASCHASALDQLQPALLYLLCLSCSVF